MVAKEELIPCGIELCSHKHEREELEKDKAKLIIQVDEWKDRCDRLRRIMENESSPKNPEVQQLAITNVRLGQDLEVFKQRWQRSSLQVDILTQQIEELNRMVREERERLEQIENEFEKSDKIIELDRQIAERKSENTKLQVEYHKLKKVTEKVKEKHDTNLKETNELREEYNKLLLQIKEAKKNVKKVKKEKKKRPRLRLRFTRE